MKKRVGLALGVGFVKGMAHIGVLKVLDKHDIPVDLVSGSSMGAIIGGLYSSGLSGQAIENIVDNTQFQKYLDFILPQEGLVAGKRIEKFLDKKMHHRTFKQMKIPFYVVATNLSKGRRVVFSKGNVAQAVSASMAYPVIFQPIKIKNDYYVDAGLVDPVPVSAIKDAGANVIIGVDVRNKVMPQKKLVSHTDKTFIKTLKDSFIEVEIENFKDYIRTKKTKVPFYLNWLLKPKRIKYFFNKSKVSSPEIIGILMNSIYVMEGELNRLKLEETKIDLLIQPNLKKITSFEFDKIDYCIRQGELAAKRALPRIKKLIR